MNDSNANNEALIFKELPKEQRKALRKEFSKTAEWKKTNTTLTIVAVIIGAIVIVGAIIGMVTEHKGFFGTFPTFFFCIWPAMISQQKFEKWLAAEKNIAIKRKR